MSSLVYNFYIFDRHGDCLFFKEWNSPKGPPPHGYVEDQKLMFGLLFSLKQFVQNLSLRDKTPDPMQLFETKRSILHIFETATGLRFVINTNKSVRNMHGSLRKIYTSLYVKHIKRNCLHPAGVGEPGGQKIVSKQFEAELDAYIKKIKLPGRPGGSQQQSSGSSGLKSGGGQSSGN